MYYFIIIYSKKEKKQNLKCLNLLKLWKSVWWNSYSNSEFNKFAELSKMRKCKVAEFIQTLNENLAENSLKNWVLKNWKNKIKLNYKTEWKQLLATPYIIYCWLLAYLRKSSRTFFVGNYLLNWLLETRNKPYTNTLCFIITNH